LFIEHHAALKLGVVKIWLKMD